MYTSHKLKQTKRNPENLYPFQTSGLETPPDASWSLCRDGRGDNSDKERRVGCYSSLQAWWAEGEENNQTKPLCMNSVLQSLTFLLCMVCIEATEAEERHVALSQLSRNPTSGWRASSKRGFRRSIWNEFCTELFFTSPVGMSYFRIRWFRW